MQLPALNDELLTSKIKQKLLLRLHRPMILRMLQMWSSFFEIQLNANTWHNMLVGIHLIP